jgi:putative restriction endonuclease
MANDPEADVRVAAFERLRYLARLYGGPIPWSGIASGFEARGERFDFATKAAGIFKPAGMQRLLSVKSTIPRRGRRVWYEDQKNIGLQPAGDLIFYSFMGSNPDNVWNRMLREAMEQQLPIIYFFGVGEATYEPIFPTFIVSWDAANLRCGLVFSPPADTLTDVAPPSPSERFASACIRPPFGSASYSHTATDAR